MRINNEAKPIHIISIGAFGQAVAATLQELLPNVVETRIADNGQTYPLLWPNAQMHLLASWRPATKISRLLNEMCYAWNTPFIEAVLETPQLRVGPVVIPGGSACHDCFEQRLRQHTARPAEHQALREFYNAQPQRGPQGYLPAFADIAAIRLTQFVAQFDRDAAAVAGQVWQLNTISRDTVQGTVVGVHACHYCGLGREEATRSYSALRHELVPVWRELEQRAEPRRREVMVAA